MGERRALREQVARRYRRAGKKEKAVRQPQPTKNVRGLHHAGMPNQPRRGSPSMTPLS